MPARVLDALVAGHLCLDIIPDFTGAPRAGLSELFIPGRLVETGAAALATGGVVSNTGLALHTLGLRTRLVGKIGDDIFGRAVREILARRGGHLADDIVVGGEGGTSYSVILSLPGVDRIFLHCPGVNDGFRAADVPGGLLSAARLFHFGYPAVMRSMYANRGSELVALFRRAKDAGATTSLDPAQPDPASASGRADWEEILRSALPWVDVFLPSIEEILFMLRRDVFEGLKRAGGGTDIMDRLPPGLLSDLGRQIISWGVKIAVIKLGDRGLYLRTAGEGALAGLGRAAPAAPADWAGREMWGPCFEVRMAGTTGCGDATIAGFLAGLLRGLPPEAALTAALAVGACSVEAPDALSGILTWPETLARIAAGWPRHDRRMEQPGWRWRENPGLWIGPCRP